MIVYNVTIKIDPDIEAEWVSWQIKEHIPEVLATGLFIEHKFFRLLEQEETDGITYVIQYYASSIADYKKYIEEFAAGLRKKAFDKWQNQFIAFRTVMEIVN
jgi:hypothetical protein